MTTAQAAKLRHQLRPQRDGARQLRQDRMLAALAGTAAVATSGFALLGAFSIGGGL